MRVTAAGFRQALRTRNFSVSQFHFGGITGKAVLTMAYPAIGGGEVAAVVFASLDLAWLNRYLSESLLPPGSVLAVMDRRGTLLARYPDPEFWVGENIGETPLAMGNPRAPARRRSPRRAAWMTFRVSTPTRRWRRR